MTEADETRFRRVFACDSLATALLQGCPVITGDGQRIGQVESLLIERKTRQLRYVLVGHDADMPTIHSAAVAIPWQALYFDSAAACLVFYTYG